MKVKYIGPSFGTFGLTNGKTYECLEVDEATGALRIIDDEGPAYWGLDPGEKDGYLYSPINPKPIDGSSPGGRWEIIEDDENGSLRLAIFGS